MAFSRMDRRDRLYDFIRLEHLQDHNPLAMIGPSPSLEIHFRKIGSNKSYDHFRLSKQRKKCTGINTMGQCHSRCVSMTRTAASLRKMTRMAG